MNLLEKYRRMGNDNKEKKKKQEQVNEKDLVKMIEKETEFDFWAIEKREKLGYIFKDLGLDDTHQ
jgi:hypothetical protein